MTELLIALGIMLGAATIYATIGILFARSQATNVFRNRYAWHRSMWKYTDEEKIVDYAERDTRSDLAIKAWFWPLEMLGAFFVGLGNGGRNLLMNPVYDRLHRAEKLRREAKTWAEVAEHPDTTASERRMAEELSNVLREQAEEVDPR